MPTLAFFHIPLPEMDDARIAWEKGAVSAVGGMREGVFCSPVNSGLFDAIKEEGSTTHILNGHDHVNNLSLSWQGIKMTYLLKTGPGSYTDKDIPGETLVTIDGQSREVSLEHIYID